MKIKQCSCGFTGTMWSRKKKLPDGTIEEAKCAKCARKDATPVGEFRMVNKPVQDLKKPKTEKSLKELKELAQIVINRYVRNLYASTDGTTRCYTCLRWESTKLMDASHFISVRHQSTRYDLNNLRSCCHDCNRYSYGNLKRFRQHLVTEIGESAVEELEMRSKESKHWTREELNELIAKYK